MENRDKDRLDLNKTPEHARRRVLDMRTGMLFEASDEYLIQLQSDLLAAADAVRAELAKRIEEQRAVDWDDPDHFPNRSRR